MAKGLSIADSPFGVFIDLEMRLELVSERKAMGAVGLDQIQRNVIAVVEAHVVAPGVTHTRIQLAAGVIFEKAAAAGPQHQPLHQPRLATDHQLGRAAAF